MRHRTVIAFLAIVSAVVGFGEEPAQPATSSGRVILDQTGYLRTYLRFAQERVSPELARAAAEKNPKGIERSRRGVLKTLGRMGLDARKLDWKAHWFRGRESYYHTSYPLTDMLPPQQGWMKPDFDDSHWVRHRRPFAAGDYFAYHLGDAYYRTWFSVPDQGEQVTLKLVCNGGARVFLNGTEIGRTHLPQGELKANTRGEAYPMDAHRVTWEETSLSTSKKKSRRRSHYTIHNLPGPLPAKAKSANGKPEFISTGRGKLAISRAAWQRLERVRNRVLGPITLPKELLKKGGNLLAVEIRGAAFQPGTPNPAFAHCHLVQLELRATSKSTPSALRRPKGLQVWTEDVHRRIYETEYLEPGAPVGVVSLKGARNGTYGGQVVVGSDKQLEGVTFTAADLSRDGGNGTIPAAAVTVRFMVPRAVARIGKDVGGARDTAEARDESELSLRRYAPPEYKALTPEKRKAFQNTFAYYDQIGTSNEGKVAANTCRPAWVSVKIPESTPPGRYAGMVKVAAEGHKPVEVPLRVEVIDWRVPNPRDFTFVSAVDQSPYGVANHYKLKPWSDEHFQKMENSFRILGRLGNDWLHVPVLLRSELGNQYDAPIKWIRSKDGALSFDFGVLDRYLDLAVKHWGKPRVISFNVMQGLGRYSMVPILDEASGKVERVDVGPKADAGLRQQYWQAFSTALYRHMKARDLADRMYWGTPSDGERDPTLMPLLARFVPDVYWVRHSHAYAPTGYYRVASTVYCLGPTVSAKRFQREGFQGRGWKWPRLHLCNSRRGATVHLLEGYFPPFSYRVLCQRAQGRGMHGVGRMGGDYWGMYCKGLSWGRGSRVGFGVAGLLWPGKEGAESSARLEVLLEGAQEMEARIYLEKALDLSDIDEKLKAGIRTCFVRHSGETGFIPNGHDNSYRNLTRYLLHDLHQGWQRRAGDLYAQASRVAVAQGLTVNQREVTLQAIPEGDNRVEVKVCNWTSAPRSWKASADVPWLKVGKASGEAAGAETLPLSLDVASLAPGKVSTGKLTITDATAKRDHIVTVNVTTPHACELIATDRIIEAVPGKKAERQVVLANHSIKPFAWNLKSSLSWLRVEPATGKLGPFERTTVTLIAEPPSGSDERKTAVITVLREGDKKVHASNIYVYAVPPERKPESYLVGEKVYLSAVHAERMLEHMPNEKKKAHVRIEPPKFDKEHNRTFPYYYREEVSYNLQGSGFEAFELRLRFHPKVAKRHGHTSNRKPPYVVMRIFVDGRMRVETRQVKAAEQEGLRVVVPFIGGARKMRIMTSGNANDPVQWLAPVFYKGKPAAGSSAD